MRSVTWRILLAVAALLVAGVGAAVAEDLTEWRRGREQSRADIRVPYAPRDDVEAALFGEKADLYGERMHEVHELLGPRHVSRLARERLAARGLGMRPMDASADAKAAVQTDTLSVLIVRIGFETDRSGDLTSVTEDGDFTLTEQPDVYVDPPPHDRDFYMAHLWGLSEYYRIQSGGKLFIRGRVLPEEPERSYKLSDIADYGPGEEGGWTLSALEHLVQDMIVAADEGTQADGDVSLADFDDDDPLTYIVFVHAGGDWQSDIYGDSPNDIPTFFVSLGESVALTSVDSETGRTGRVTECSVVPESTTQDGLYGSIAGPLYHEFGHALGLPDVYDTGTGYTVAGYWDLMDSGPNLYGVIGVPDPEDTTSYVPLPVIGLMPPSLSAWNRWYLGWLKVDELRGDEHEVHLPAVQVPVSDYYTWYRGSSAGGDPYDFSAGYPQALVAGAAPSEFFLLENRWVPMTSDELPDESGLWLIDDDDTGVILYMGGDRIDGDGPFRNTGMYDWFMPAGGLLVWHVDQERILEGLPDNSINQGSRGLSLVEADGITDLGVYDFYADGIIGSDKDPFHSGTSDHLDAEGSPSSLAWDRSRTGVVLTDISGPTATMTFRGAVHPLAPGSPWSSPDVADPPDSLGVDVWPRTLDTSTLTPFLLDGAPAVLCASTATRDAAGEIFPGEDAAPWLFGWRTDGSACVTAPTGAPSRAVWGNGSEPAGPPLAIPGPSGSLLVVGTRDGCVIQLPPETTGGTWIPEWSTAVGDTLVSAPVIASYDGGLSLACRVGARTLRFLSPFSGDLLGETELVAAGAPTDACGDPLVMDLGDATWGLVAVSGLGWTLWDGESVAGGLWADGEGDLTNSDSGVPPYASVMPLESDSRALVLAEDGGAFFLDAGAGDPETTALPDRIFGKVVAAPAVADVDGDGRHDWLVVADTHVHAFHADYTPLQGWPVRLLGSWPFDDDVAFDGSVAIFDGDGDGLNEVWLGTTGGHLTAFDAGGELVDGTPFLWGDRGGAGLAVGGTEEWGRVLWLAEPGGRTGSVFGVSRTSTGGHDLVSGRLAAYMPPTETQSGATSEWLGLLGGVARMGPTGEAAEVEGSTMAAESGRTWVYPNPLRDGAVAFRFLPEADGPARVTIYNLEGELVEDLDAAVVEGGVSEILWTPTDLASGVYLCRMQYPGVDGDVVVMERLAVER